MTRRPTRREWLAGSVAGIALGLRPGLSRAQSPSPYPSGEWPIFRGDAALQGVGVSALPAELKLAWSFEAESEPSSVVVSAGRAVFATRDGDLVSLDLPTGRPLWRKKVEAGFEAAPTLSGSRVLISDLEGGVHAFNAADGAKMWTHQTEEKSEIKASVAVADGSAIVGAYDGTLHAVSLADGSPRWTHQSDAQIHATCSIRDGLAFVAGCDGHLRGIEASTGKVRIDVQFGGYTASSPAISGDLAVFGTFSDDVVAVDLARKVVAWRYRPKKHFPFYSSAAVSGDRAFVGSRDKALHVLNIATGELEWAFETQGRIDSSPALAGSRVFFGSHDGRIRGVDVQSRKGVFSYETGSPVAASPAIAGNRLLVGSTDGRILCFG